MHRMAQLARSSGSPADAFSGVHVVVGRIVALDADGSLVVRSGALAGQTKARLAVPASEAELREAIATAQEVLLACEGGDPARPIVVGFIQKPATAAAERSDRVDGPPAAGAEAASEVRPAGLSPAEPAPTADPARTTEHLPQVVEADVDGKRVRVVAEDEIVLQCGEASITLRRNGRVVVRGTYVETHSDGTNRIKGGQVRIN